MTEQIQVLVVEDRADWQDIVCEAVAGQGYKPYATASYDEAMKAFEEQRFDIAIIDPVLDRANPFNRAGVSIIQRINEAQPALPIIVVTGSFAPDIKASLEALRPQAPVFFKETWNPVEFGNALNQQLRGESRPQPSGAPQPENEQSLPDPRPLTPPPTAAAGRPRVLIVENRRDWQEIVAETLDEATCFWRIAHNGQEALFELERERFHLIVLDLKLQAAELPMPSSEGWLLLDHIVEAYPKTKVVIMSGRAAPGDVAELLTRYSALLGFIDKERFSRQAILDAVAQATQAPELTLQTFGQFRVWRDGRAIPKWERPQAEWVVKLLLVKRATGGRAMTADELMTHLWPDTDEASGRKKLLPLISNARAILEPDIEPRDSNFILRTGNGYFFDLSGRVTWDLLTFRKHLSAGRDLFRAARWTEAIAELEQGLELYKGDFLAEDRYADWAVAARHDIANEYRDLLIYLADASAALGRYPQAIKACEKALRKDPLLESVYRRLMRFHYCNGDKGQALKVYRDCRMLFEEMFEENPTLATRKLHDAIANNEPVECLSES